MNYETLRVEGHRGLANMLERMMLVGGRLEVESVPGNGALVRCVMPDIPEAARCDRKTNGRSALFAKKEEFSMLLKVIGAAGEVTGSSYLIECGASRVLVDCGIFQGKDDERKNSESFPFAAGSLDAVLLTMPTWTIRAGFLSW